MPGSHRDHRNPRGLHDGTDVAAPIPGEMQVVAPAGSMFIQDTRAWYCSAMHVPEGERVAMVNCWAPWWLSVQDIGGGHVGYKSKGEWEALPASVQPLVKHLCPDVEDSAQQEMLDRAEAANVRTGWGFAQQGEDPNVFESNAHVQVPSAPTMTIEPPLKHWGPKQSTPFDDVFSEVAAASRGGAKLRWIKV